MATTGTDSQRKARSILSSRDTLLTPPDRGSEIGGAVAR
jgi:hypothetical protein